MNPNTRILAASIVLVTILQLGACCLSCDCFTLPDGRTITAADSGCDHDGCPCCALHSGTQVVTGIDPGMRSDLLTLSATLPIATVFRLPLYPPPRS